MENERAKEIEREIQAIGFTIFEIVYTTVCSSVLVL